MDNRF